MNGTNMTTSERSAAWVGDNLDNIKLTNESENVDDIIKRHRAKKNTISFSMDRKNFISDEEAYGTGNI